MHGDQMKPQFLGPSMEPQGRPFTSSLSCAPSLAHCSMALWAWALQADHLGFKFGLPAFLAV